MTNQVNKTLLTLALCAASLSLTACGSHLHKTHGLNANCAPYTQNCAAQASRYGHDQHNGYDFVYGGQYVQTYSYLNSPAPSSYVQPTVPAPTPAPVSIPAPVAAEPIIFDEPSFEPAPIPEPSPPISSWVAPEPEPAWAPPWREDVDCPEGTIPGYGGDGCVQVDIWRK